MLDKKLLEILVCPKCRSELVYNEERCFLICESCCLRYDVKDGIPLLLIDEAEAL